MSEDRETRTLENKENNAPENTKIKKTKNKSAGILAGEVTAWIVLVLSVISLCFRVFHVNLPSITPVVEMIEDSSGFMTFLCLAFAAASEVKKPRSHPLALLCLGDIVLVNHLYSNERMNEIVAWILQIDRNLLIFGVIAAAAVGLIVWRVVKVRREKGDSLEGSIPEYANPEGEYTNDSSSENGSPNGDSSGDGIPSGSSSDDGKVPHKKPKKDIRNRQRNDDNNEKKSNKVYIKIVIALSIAAIFISPGVGDYVFYDLLSIGERPKFMEKYYEYLRYGTAGLITLVVILLIIVLIVLWIKTYLENIQGFEISAVLAIVAEIILFACWKNGSKPEYITNTMLDSLANNWFAAGLVLGFVFLVLQIMIIIGIDLLFKGLGFDDKSILDLGIEERILSIEKKMIKLALGIIEGCVSLFDFIPDFFVTIGALVFDKKESGEKGDK